MRALFLACGVLVAGGVLAAGCQYLIDIPDGRAAGDGDGDGDAGVDSGFAGECNPLTQEGCGPGQKCTSQGDPGGSTTVCTKNGTVGLEQPCTVGSDGIDDCLAGLGCGPDGSCHTVCEVEPKACGSSETCRDRPELFTDQSGRVGLCEFRCDPVLQDCPNDACYLNVALGEGQCRPQPSSGSPVQDDPCVGDAAGCDPNGCSFGHGPHLSVDPGGPIQRCAAYCAPVDTYAGSSANPGGDPFILDCAAAVGDGGGSGSGSGSGSSDYQCRFIEVVLDSIPTPVGMCVNSTTAWGDCTQCDASSQSSVADTCPVGCVSKAFFNQLPP